jgi:hypothetical protein
MGNRSNRIASEEGDVLTRQEGGKFVLEGEKTAPVSRSGFKLYHLKSQTQTNNVTSPILVLW